MRFLKCIVWRDKDSQSRSFISEEEILGFVIIPRKYINRDNIYTTDYEIKVLVEHIDYVVSIDRLFDTKELAEKFIIELIKYKEDPEWWIR